MRATISAYRRTTTWVATTCAVLALTACGGGGGGGGARHAIGGTVSGLTGTVVLVLSGVERLSIASNGPFMFSTTFRPGRTYVVNVVSQPAGLVCNVQNGGGQMPAADVTDIVVTCGPPGVQEVYRAIGGTISGLTGTVVLYPGSYMDEQAFSTNGPFAFAELSAIGGMYDVQVTQQPDGQICAIADGYGEVSRQATNVLVNCADSSALFALRGTISGLTGDGLRLEAGPGSFVEPPAGATSFALPEALGNAVAYQVGIAAQPAGQTCVIQRATGGIIGSDVDDIDVRCVDNVTDPLSGTYAAPGLQPGSYVYVTLFPDGTYIYGSIEDNVNCNSYGYYANTRGNGVEYGVYRYDAATHAFSVRSAVVDSNGYCGVWDDDIGMSRVDGTLTVAGSGPSTVLTLTPIGGTPINLVPVASVDGGLAGGWASAYRNNFVTFIPGPGNRYYYMLSETQNDEPPRETGIEPGVEYGCVLQDVPEAGGLWVENNDDCDAPTPSFAGGRDANGRAGLLPLHRQSEYSVAGDTLNLNGVEYRRIRPQ